MNQESFPLRHRGVHLPHHLHRLELVSSGPSPRTRGGGLLNFRPLIPPQSRRDLLPTKPRSHAEHTGDDRLLASFFGNLSVWIQNVVHSAHVHAGYDKIHLYLAVLRVFVDEIVPYSEIQRLVADIETYILYLSSSEQQHVVVELSGTSSRAGRQLSLQAAGSPRYKAVLSPRVLKAMAQEVAGQASLSSPRIVEKQPKKIIELSDHEESILEIALFYDEVVTQHCNMTTHGPVKKPKNALHPGDTSLTQQWLLFTADKRRHVLKNIKSKITKSGFFGSSASSAAAALHSNTPIASSSSRTHVLPFSAYFSLVTLCLQETTRRISVFSAEIAAFIWSELCQDTQHHIELVFQDLLAVRTHSHESLEQLKSSRRAVEDAIAHCELEIERLQCQNVRSLAVWELERQEMTMLEQEEAWHGHCKALLLKTLVALQADVHQPTFLQVRSASVSDGEAENLQNAGAPAIYQRLPPGAALLHSQLRSRVVYMAHLVVLSRSFLHLHEKRGLREVMESTSTNPQWTTSPPSPSHSAQLGGDAYDSQLVPITPMYGHDAVSPMERMSRSELLTLKQINDALRAIEELYVSIGGSGDHMRSSSVSIARIGCDIATQFPILGDNDDLHTMGEAGAGFTRSLAYSTMAVGSFANTAPPLVRAGSKPRRRNAEIVQPRMGSGRRVGSVLLAIDDNQASSPPTRPLLRLAKAVAKLPRHICDVLVLPLLESDPFPLDNPSSTVEALARDEILARIQWIYTLVIAAAFAPSFATVLSTGATTAIPLARQLWKSWNTEQFVEFIYAAFIEKYDNNLHVGEREFVRFLASIQLLFSGLSAALNPSTGGAGPSQGNDKIHFFARMAKLLYVERERSSNNNLVAKTYLPARLFPIFFYCHHVLQHAVVTKKRIDEDGLVVDVWTAPQAAVPPAMPPSASRHSGSIHATRRTAKATSGVAATKAYTFRSHALHTCQFVLLESVKTLLVYLMEGTSPDATRVVEDRSLFLENRATLAKVALLSPVTPGSYNIQSAPTSSSSSSTSGSASACSPSPPVANGELTDVLILPLDFAVQAIVDAWLTQHQALLHRLTVGMRAANIATSGEITFEEFTHVMMVGSAAMSSSSAASAAATAISTGQLTQVYASRLSDKTAATHAHGRARWQELIVAVADEIDLLGMGERLTNVDFRSIQRALLHHHPGSAASRLASPWVLNPSYRSGDAVSLHKAWALTHEAMRENFALCFQAERALEGVCLWQSGLARMARVGRLLRATPATTVATRGSHSGAHHRTAADPALVTTKSRCSTTSTGYGASIEMTAEELEIARRALYYLQLDHGKAHHIADHVRAIQQQQQQLRSSTLQQ